MAIESMNNSSEFFKMYCIAHPGFAKESAQFWKEHKDIPRELAYKEFKQAFPDYKRARRAYDKKHSRIAKQLMLDGMACKAKALPSEALFD